MCESDFFDEYIIRANIRIVASVDEDSCVSDEHAASVSAVARMSAPAAALRIFVAMSNVPFAFNRGGHSSTEFTCTGFSTDT